MSGTSGTRILDNLIKSWGLQILQAIVFPHFFIRLTTIFNDGVEDMPPVSHWAAKNTFCMLLHRKILRQNAVVFRHDFCTKLYYSGISRKKAVEIMGHARYQMIEKVYAALDEKQEKSSEKIDAMFKNIM